MREIIIGQWRGINLYGAVPNTFTNEDINKLHAQWCIDLEKAGLHITEVQIQPELIVT